MHAEHDDTASRGNKATEKRIDGIAAAASAADDDDDMEMMIVTMMMSSYEDKVHMHHVLIYLITVRGATSCCGFV